MIKLEIVHDLLCHVDVVKPLFIFVIKQTYKNYSN